MKTVTISTDLILSLINRKDARKQIPAFRQAAEALTKTSGRVGCGRYGKRKGQTKIAAAVREQIQSWPPEYKQKLKELLGADKVRYYTVPGRRGGNPSLVEF